MSFFLRIILFINVINGVSCIAFINEDNKDGQYRTRKVTHRTRYESLTVKAYNLPRRIVSGPIYTIINHRRVVLCSLITSSVLFMLPNMNSSPEHIQYTKASLGALNIRKQSGKTREVIYAKK